MRSGRLGCCIAASARKAPIPAEMLKVIGFAIELAGCPVVKGGAECAAHRLRTADHGQWRRDPHRRRCRKHHSPVPAARAGGVRLAGGETLQANAGVICSVTPNQLYERLMKDWPTTLPADVKTGVATLSLRQGQYADPLRALRSRRAGRPMRSLARSRFFI